MIGDSLTTALLQKALDGTWQRQRAVSNNIANHETPGYKTQKVDFENALSREVSQLQAYTGKDESKEKGISRINNMEISSYAVTNTSNRADGNNVDLDAENIEMARAQIQYDYLTREMTDVFSRLRYAISEGKK